LVNPIRTAMTVPLRDFKEKENVEKKVTAETLFFHFSASLISL
jgi:hypothetical protein